jgi:hypothetical protein
MLEMGQLRWVICLEGEVEVYFIPKMKRRYDVRRFLCRYEKWLRMNEIITSRLSVPLQAHCRMWLSCVACWRKRQTSASDAGDRPNIQAAEPNIWTG